MNDISLTRQIPVLGNYDIIVAGGGVAGVAAAYSARRHGKSVLLIEKAQKLGGLATTGIVNLFVPMCNGRGVQIVKGLAEEFLRLSIKYGYDDLADIWKEGEPQGPVSSEPPRYRTHFSAEIFALTLTELMHDAGVDILFDTLAVHPIMSENRCDGLVVENKSGTGFYSAKIIIDTTGDIDLLFRAGVPTVQGKNYFTYYGQQITLDDCDKAVKNKNIRYAMKYIFGGDANLYGEKHPADMPFFKGTDALDVNDYLIKNQLFLLEKIKKQDRWSRDIVTLPGMAQFRTTRHINGDYTITEQDAYKHFDDSVTAVCDFDRRDYLFEVPYRAMVNKRFDNFITAGRCISASGYAWDVTRVVPVAIVTGQAAGLASSLSVDSGCPISEINTKNLQHILQSENVIIHFDDTLIPNDSKRESDKELII